MEIVANSTTVFPLNAISTDNISITLAQPLLAGNGRSIEIDLTTSVRSKSDLIKGIQLEPGSSPEKKYPAVISGNTVDILPIQSGDSNYVTVTSIIPPSAETGRSIGIDLSDSAKSTIYNAHQYARRDEANVLG